MSAFTGRMVIEEIVPGSTWRTVSDLVYEIGYLGSGRFVIVPAGTVTDGASIPRPLSAVLAVWGTYGRAALLHDYLYQQLRIGKPHVYAADRRAAAALFFAAMQPLGTSAWLRWLMWAAVRIFGGQLVRQEI